MLYILAGKDKRYIDKKIVDKYRLKADSLMPFTKDRILGDEKPYPEEK
jgi:hypothetical protein